MGNSVHVQKGARVGGDVMGDSLSHGTRSTRDHVAANQHKVEVNNNMTEHIQQTAIRTLSQHFLMNFRRDSQCCGITQCIIVAHHIRGKIHKFFWSLPRWVGLPPQIMIYQILSGPRKPLENVTLAQWSVANLTTL